MQRSSTTISLLKKEQAEFKNLPVLHDIKTNVVLGNYLNIKKDISSLIETELARMMDTPELTDLIVRKS